jgi:hypothetical protein
VGRRPYVNNVELFGERYLAAHRLGRRVGAAEMRQELLDFDLVVHIALGREYRGRKVQLASSSTARWKAAADSATASRHGANSTAMAAKRTSRSI